MSNLLNTISGERRRLSWLPVAIFGMLLIAAVSIPNLMRARMPADEPRARTYFATKSEASAAPTSPSQTASLASQKMIRTSAVELLVQNPAEVLDRVIDLTERLGGYVVSSEGGGRDAKSGVLTVRVPLDKFEAMRSELRKVALRVESERIEAQDVTRQYVDQEATLRNLRAEENQYLAILKEASSVNDMLNVTARLTEVRGRIEQQQAEFDALTKQVETVAISISLRTQEEAEVFGLNWRPLYRLKVAFRDGLDEVADYASVMTGLVFHLPAVLLWLGTILASAVVGWKILAWVGKRFDWMRPTARVPEGS